MNPAVTKSVSLFKLLTLDEERLEFFELASLSAVWRCDNKAAAAERF